MLNIQRTVSNLCDILEPTFKKIEDLKRQLTKHHYLMKACLTSLEENMNLLKYCDVHVSLSKKKKNRYHLLIEDLQFKVHFWKVF